MMRSEKREAWWGWRVAVSLSLGGSLALNPAALGQTLFQLPDTADVARYTRIEECRAAVNRGGRTWQMLEPVPPRADTTAWDPLWWQHAVLPTRITATAQRCSAKYVEPQTPLTDWVLLMPIYLAANRDSDAATLVHRRLAAATSNAERQAIIDSAVNIYTGSPLVGRRVVLPPRFAAANALQASAAGEAKTPLEKLDLYGKMMRVANREGDSLKRRTAAQRFLTEWQSATEAEHRQYSQGLSDAAVNVILLGIQREATGDQEDLDSLRHSTASYAAFRQQQFQQVVKTGLPMPIGERAPKLEGDFWYPKEAAGTPRPTPGKIALVVFLDHPHADMTAILHRLTQRFSTLEVTIVTRTQGFFQQVEPPTPAQEAEYLAKEWAGTFYQVPLALVVNTTPFMQLPAPDRRWIPQPGYVNPNRAHYSFGGTWDVSWQGSAFLVDQQGLIVYASSAASGAQGGVLTRFEDGELEVAKLTEVLLHRPVTALNNH